VILQPAVHENITEAPVSVEPGVGLDIVARLDAPHPATVEKAV
jgi:hypothetical protein